MKNTYISPRLTVVECQLTAHVCVMSSADFMLNANSSIQSFNQGSAL